MREVMREVRATRGLIGIKDKYVDLIRELTAAAAPMGLEVHTLGDYYPAGDEFITVFETTVRVNPPGGLPGDGRAGKRGFGKPLAVALRRFVDEFGAERPTTWRERLAASHPPPRTRIARIEAMLRRKELDQSG